MVPPAVAVHQGTKSLNQVADEGAYHEYATGL